MACAEAPGRLHVTVALAHAPSRVEQVELELAAGACVADAVRESGLAARHPELDLEAMRTAVWGRSRPLKYRLRERDRVELLHPLKVDPKEARRLRQRGQTGAR